MWSVFHIDCSNTPRINEITVLSLEYVIAFIAVTKPKHFSWYRAIQMIEISMNSFGFVRFEKWKSFGAVLRTGIQSPLSQREWAMHRAMQGECLLAILKSASVLIVKLFSYFFKTCNIVSSWYFIISSQKKPSLNSKLRAENLILIMLSFAGLTFIWSETFLVYLTAYIIIIVRKNIFLC